MLSRWKSRDEDRDRQRLRDDDGFRIRAAGVCIRGEGKETVVLLVSGGKDGRQWVVPGGGVEKDECAEEAARRELMEEAGVRAQTVELIGVFQDDIRKHRTQVFLMKVSEELQKWQEGEFGRQRTWMSLIEGAEKVKQSHRPIIQALLSRGISIDQRNFHFVLLCFVKSFSGFFFKQIIRSVKFSHKQRVGKIFSRMAYQLGKNTLTVSAEIFKENRKRLLEALKKTLGANENGNVVFLEGGKEKNRYNTDAEDLPFRQESYFFWTFGVHESDFYGAIDLDSGKSFLFPPRLDPSYAIWDGKINGEDWFKNKYEVDEVHFNDRSAIANKLQSINTQKILLLRADNTDSGNVLEPASFEGIEKFSTDVLILYKTIAELRVLKTDKELEVMRYASKIASEAHRVAMKNMKPGLYEYQLESLFRHTSYFHGGCRHLAYTCIAASGCNGSVLHYGHANAPNDKLIKDGDMCLFDMGPEYNCYASDITTSFPSNGKFTDQQKIIYNAVLEASLAVFREAKPGVRWTDMHILSERVILQHLKAAGLVTGDIEEAVAARIGAVFMPHGLGHLIGLDVHDCGGYLGDATPRSTLPGLRSLRTTRTLQERMVITIEPGCYFIDTLLDQALADPSKARFLVKTEVDKYRGFGGVRIEDDVVIWAKGNENMSDLPRTVEEIEKFMKDGDCVDEAVSKRVQEYLRK
ncbi:unnamed protein product [Caenorhabditis auriculariae]|uniref:Xaa-Pro dipeptidase n=1 Tax=Caenorhabditis auriculariae TaxID=2777116 RepID=A0A8S1GME1_9PELO|nr:unnamed protein product [Caenorhabditis auriculariae]